MSLSQTLLLGFVAGATIVLGLPVARLKTAAPRVRVLLNAVAIGVLLFLFWDVVSAAWGPIDAGLSDLREGKGGPGAVLARAAVMASGLALALVGLAAYERSMPGNGAGRQAVLRTGAHFGPGAMSGVEAAVVDRRGILVRSAPLRVAFLIAVGIGLHNFAEGLAIGQSAADGQLGLATTLVIGFALHNATEGFGIVAPLAADTDSDRPSWGLLGVLALIGGGPTFLGTLVGHGFTSDIVSIGFLSLAAGSILYVVMQLLQIAGKARRNDLVAIGLFVGLAAGFATDAVVTLAGV